MAENLVVLPARQHGVEPVFRDIGRLGNAGRGMGCQAVAVYAVGLANGSKCLCFAAAGGRNQSAAE